MIKKFATFCIFIFLSSCGFKVAEIKRLTNFYIYEVTTSGDTRINYILKNKLQQNAFDNNKKPVFVNLTTIKTKTIKEKNIQNEITKYSLTITISVDIKDANKSVLRSFTLRDGGSFLVKTKHSETMNNEKKLIIDLSNKLATEIQNKIILMLNNI